MKNPTMSGFNISKQVIDSFLNNWYDTDDNSAVDFFKGLIKMTINIGETIKSLRKDKNITQETLANFLGVTNQSISKWERNETYPDITILPAIASFFRYKR